jgi:ribonuclease HII
VTWALGVIEVEEIDCINILEASLLAMGKAVRALQVRPDCLLIDGKQSLPVQFFRSKKLQPKFSRNRELSLREIKLCFSIAAASILAMLARDAIMMELDKGYPEYGSATHKGYACTAHLEALRRFGPSPVHRRSSKPVRDLYIEVLDANLTLFPSIAKSE